MWDVFDAPPRAAATDDASVWDVFASPPAVDEASGWGVFGSFSSEGNASGPAAPSGATKPDEVVVQGACVRKDPAAGARALATALSLFTDDEGSEINAPLPAIPQASAYASLPAWVAHPPHTFGSIRLVDSLSGVGGSRGFVATRQLQIGEVLLVEEPFVVWPCVERTPVSILYSVLSSRSAPQILAALAHLHPADLRTVPPAELERLREEYHETVQTLAPLWSRCSEMMGQDAGVHGDAILRLCLAVQWNAFDSGIFLHQAIFNHRCAHYANCEKASHMMTVRDGSGKEMKKVLSVVRVTRLIAAGELRQPAAFAVCVHIHLRRASVSPPIAATALCMLCAPSLPSLLRSLCFPAPRTSGSTQATNAASVTFSLQSSRTPRSGKGFRSSTFIAGVGVIPIWIV